MKKNALVINGIEIPFLPEYELPKSDEMGENLRDIASSSSASNTESSSISTGTIASQPSLNLPSPGNLLKLSLFLIQTLNELLLL